MQVFESSEKSIDSHPSKNSESTGTTQRKKYSIVEISSDEEYDALNDNTHSNSGSLGSDKNKKKFVTPGGVKSTIVNLLISTLGPGIIALPSAYRMSGLLGGLLWFVISTVVSWLSIYSLVSLKEIYFFLKFCKLMRFLIF